ncbi:MAG: lysylphosphatidylglycerol synthase transmembrane domain-containing protein [Candidatus Omnitrophica bacterium]|nr:lysylphosphatidylglycerol synthase transmembrane domain-containing protein [Candidatus Omnitrophota bacterium]
MTKTLSQALRALLSFSFIVLLLYIMRDKYPQILKAFASTKVPIFLLGLLIFASAAVVGSVRLKLLIEAQGINVTFKEALSLTFIGYFFNNFLPTSIGGDVAKAYYLSKKTEKKAGAYASVFVDRVIGLFTMISMAFLALFFVEEGVVDSTLRYIIYAITLGSIIFLVLMTNKKLAQKFSFLFFIINPIKEKLRKVYEVIHQYQYQKTLMIKSFAISFVSQILFFTSLGVVALSIGSRIPVKDLLIKMPIVSMMSLLPSINGLGLREGSTVVLFGPLIGSDKAFAMSILWLLILLCISIMGGLIYAFSQQFKISIKDIDKGAI